MNNEYLTDILAGDLPVESEQPANQQPSEHHKVSFSPEQQAKVDEIIRKAQGRAAKELRTENERLRLELEATRQANPQPADDGTKLLATELAATKAERDALARERQETTV